jgi:hypothetical protein
LVELNKANRVLTFLMGLRHPQVARAMIQYGFSQVHLDQGWQNVRDVTRIRLGKQEPTRDPRTIEVLDKFENVWVVVSKAVLQHRYPQVHDALFRNLKQGSGDTVALTVMTFLSRLGEMEAGEGEYSEDGPQAREELRARGLTDEIVAEAQAHTKSLSAWIEPLEEDVDSKKEREESEERMWAGYKEWGAIARVAITDRRLLRGLGYLSPKKASRGEEEVDDDSAEAADVVVTEETAALLDVSASRALTSKPSAPTQNTEEVTEETAAE